MIGLLAVCAFGADAQLDTLLKGVETRYNKAKTLQVLFHEDIYAARAGPADGERHRSCCASRGRCAGITTSPRASSSFRDGKYLWLYTPDENRAEKMKLKESDDMRAPLAFLLGKLNFDKEFRNLQAQAGRRRHADHGRAQDRQPALFRGGIRGRPGPAHQGGQSHRLRSARS